MEFPADRQYAETHEWVIIEGDTATVGITDYASEQLGDIVFVNLPELGDEVTKGEPFTDVESVKAVSEMFSPVSGIVSEINELLLDEPGKINENPNEAWFIKVEQITETGDLMDAAAYTLHCA